MGATTDAMDTLQRLLRVVKTHLGSDHQLHAQALTEIQLNQQSLERARGFANLSLHFEPACASTEHTNHPISSKRSSGREVRIIEKLLDRGRSVWAAAVFRSWVSACMTDSMADEDVAIEQLKKISLNFLRNRDPISAEIALRLVVRLSNRRNTFGDKGQDLRNALMDWTSCLQSMKKQDRTNDVLNIFK